jgi:ligand-binding sensor domain-containing protein
VAHASYFAAARFRVARTRGVTVPWGFLVFSVSLPVVLPLSVPAFGDVSPGAKLPVVEGKDLRFMYRSSEEGLSQIRVGHILQDDQGFMWFGTYNGLEDKAGRLWVATVTRYPHFQNVPLDRIYEDRSGVLWFSSARSGGMAALDRRTGTFMRYTFGDKKTDTPSMRAVAAIHEGEDGMLWLRMVEGSSCVTEKDL